MRAATISACVESSPPETPITACLMPGRAQPLHEAGDLDVVGLVAILRESRRVGRHEGEALDAPAQTEIERRRLQPEIDAAEMLGADATAIVVERAHPHAFLPQQVEIDIGHRDLVALGEAATLGEQRAVLEHRHLAVPGEIGGGFARAGGRVEVGGEAARRLRLAEQFAGSPPCQW